MGGGNHQPKPPPPPSSSSSINRQSRWQKDNNNTNINNNNNNNSSSSSNPNNNKHHHHHPKPSPNNNNNNNNNKAKPPNNPNPNPHHPHPNPNPSSPSSRHPHPPFPLFLEHPPPPPPPPPPAYGFHMLERRTIILADGTVRSYLALPPDYHHTPTPTSKRKTTLDDIDHLARQRDHLLRTANLHNNNNNADPDIMMMRPNKQSRVSHADASASSSLHHHATAKLKKAFLHYAKLINENPTLKNTLLADGKQGRLHCAACSRSAKEFPNMHALIMHTYNTDNADLRVDHLGLHKALCVLMGWNYSKPPDNSKAYQFLSADEAAANQDDLIMWPPLVIIHNTNTGKSRDGRMEGLGNKNMDSRIRELGFTGGKSKSLYGRDGHLGITLIKFAGDQSGLNEAMQLAEYLEKESHGRKDWIRLQSLTLGKDDENNPNLVKVDEENGEKRRILYGYLGTVFDLDKVDFDTRKKVAIESKREYKPSM